MFIIEQIGLVFCGGGAKGAYQIGVWQALRALGIEDSIAAVSGDSVGALNSYLFSCENLEQARDIWRYDATANNFFNPLDFKLGEGFSRDGLKSIIKNIDDSKYLVSNRKTFVCTCAEKELKFTDISGCAKDKIEQPLLASSAIPGLYGKRDIDGVNHRDPMLYNDMPVEPIYKMGIKKIILVSLKPKPNENALDKYSKECEIILIKPNRDLGSMFDFDRYHREVLMEYGFKDCMAKYKGADTTMPEFFIKLMEEVFTSEEVITGFCAKYNRTLKFNTLGGKSFWKNIFEFQGYVIQQHIWNDKHIRILDENNIRIASFLFEDFYKCLEDYKNEMIARKYLCNN